MGNTGGEKGTLLTYLPNFVKSRTAGIARRFCFLAEQKPTGNLSPSSRDRGYRGDGACVGGGALFRGGHFEFVDRFALVVRYRDLRGSALHR